MVLSSYLTTQTHSSIQLRRPLQTHFPILLPTSIASAPSCADYKAKLNPNPHHYCLCWYLLGRRDSEMKCLVTNRFFREWQGWISSMVGETGPGARWPSCRQCPHWHRWGCLGQLVPSGLWQRYGYSETWWDQDSDVEYQKPGHLSQHLKWCSSESCSMPWWE